VIFGDRTRRMGHQLDAHTFPELMGIRFRSRFIQGFSGLVIFLFMPLYTSVVIIGAAKFISSSFAIDYEIALFGFSTIVALYVIMGGLKGVMYTDAFQGTLMLVGMLFLLIFTYSRLGGVVEAHQQLTDMAPVAREVFKGTGHQGWTAFPIFGSQFWWIMVSTIIMGVGIGVLAQPQLVVRFMTVRSKRELNRAVLIGGFFILIVVGVVYVVGSLSNVFFFQETGKIAIVTARGNVNEIIPKFIEGYLPEWFGIIFLLTLLAAAMSTISSQFHTMGTSIGRDFYEKGIRGGKQAIRSITVTRIGILIAIFFSVFLGYWLEKTYGGTGTAIIARGTAIFFGLCAATFLPMYFGALYSRKITRAGAIAGMMTGFMVSAFWLLFMHAKESTALLLCNRIFGKPSLLQYLNETTGKWVSYVNGPIIWSDVDPIIFALPLAILATIGYSLVTKAFPEKHLDRCFNK
ncbi:MAG: sodium:solute symporter family protein, partial [Candidatus Auribacterota bacterium]|nr:sodium:solute symporter family protein [Candidatus Auribacterota bacterium]